MRTATRRFEYKRGQSNKFWEVYCVGASMFARWGRIGSKGQSKEWGYGSIAAARSMASRKANEKTRKGYVEITPPSTIVFGAPLDGEDAARAKVLSDRVNARAAAREEALRLSGKVQARIEAEVVKVISGEPLSITRERERRAAARKKKKAKPRVPKEVKFKRRGPRIG